MANVPLTGNTISSSYQGLLKAGDSGAIGATEKIITDGLANASTLSLGTSSASFTGTLDLSGATVTGLPAAAAGLVSGTGTDSMKNADSLVTTPAVALGLCAIALGDAACAKTNNDIAIGTGAVTSNGNSISIGCGACNGNSDCSIVIGKNAQVNGWSRLIAIGANSCHVGNGYGGAAIGCSACAYGPGVSIGNQAKAAAFISGVSIGDRTCVTANGAVALGTQVVAATADTVSVKALETQTASTPTAGGIIMTDAGSTARRLNIDASGNLQIDSTPVGGGGGVIQSLVADTTYTNTMLYNSGITFAGATATGDYGIGIGAATVSKDSIALGNGATTFGDFSTALGRATCACNGSIAIGNQARSLNTCSVSVGTSSLACGSNSVAVGGGGGNFAAEARANFAIAIGYDSYAQNGCNIAIGCGSCTTANNSQAIGKFARAFGDSAQALGLNAVACNNYAVSIGPGSAAANVFSTALGFNARACANTAVAIGYAVTATRTDTLTTCQLEACAVGKGIVVTSPDGLTTLGIGIDNSGNIVTYTP